MKDLIQRLRNTPNWQREAYADWKTGTAVYDRAPFEAADALERLTAGDVELPESDWHPAPHERAIKPEDAIDYGNRKDAAGYQRGVTAERERCALVSEQAFRFAKDGYEIADLIREGTP
jgi:hypothetical protein